MQLELFIKKSILRPDEIGIEKDESNKKTNRIAMIDTIEQVEKDVKTDFFKNAKSVLDKAIKDGTIKEIEKALTDPLVKKQYDDFILKSLVDDKMVINQLLSLMFDVEVSRNTIEGYDFPIDLSSYAVLRRAGRSLPAQLIKSYRYNQIIEFANISDGKNPGFNITYLDKKKKLSKTEKKKCEELENQISNDFFFIPNNETPTMAQFLYYLYNDIFDLDTVAVEIIREKASFNQKYNDRGKPTALTVVDAGIIFPIVPKVVDQQNPNNSVLSFYQPMQTRINQKKYLGYKTYYQDEYRWGMIDKQMKLVAVFTPERLIYRHFFGTSDVNQQFRGLSICERALNVMRYIQDSIVYNYTRRSANTMPKGMIAIIGATEDGFSKQEMALFRKLIWGISSGMRDKWKYPVVGVPKGVEPKFIKFHETSRQMEDFMWISTLFTWMCHFEGIKPEDLSMSSNKNTLGKQRLFDKREEGQELKSQDAGLRGFLANIASTLNNSGIFEELSGIEGVGLIWGGLDVEDEAKKLDVDIKKLNTTSSINDLLVEADKEKQELMMGEVNIYDLAGIGNTQFMQLISNALMGQGQEQEEGEGEEGEEGSEYDEYPNWEEEEKGEEKGKEKPIKKVKKSLPKGVLARALYKKKLKKSINGKDVTLTIEY